MLNPIKEVAATVGGTVQAAKAVADDVRKSTARILGQAGSESSEALRAAAVAVDGLADRTEERFASASRYVRACDTTSMLQDARRLVRRHPGSFLLAASALAAVLGYAAGRGTTTPRRIAPLS